MKKVDKAFNSLTRKSIQRQLKDFNKLGEAKYILFATDDLFMETGEGTSKSKTYFIFENGQYYPLKAIARMAQLDINRSIKNYHSEIFAEAIERHGFEIHYNSAERLPQKPVKIAVSSREQKYYSVLSRPGQAKFRKGVFEKHGEQCVLTGCDVTGALEAAHLVPYAKAPNDNPNNGIPLRRDVHRLFDYHLIGINPDGLTVHLSKSVDAYYRDQVLTIIKDLRADIDRGNLTARWMRFQNK